jgi:hypothetical protein
MLSEEQAGYARELRRLLRQGTLVTSEATVDPGGGAAVPLDVAAAVALHDLDDLINDEQHGREITSDRWQQLGDELTYLYWLAIQAR